MFAQPKLLEPNNLFIEEVAQRCSVKKVFLKNFVKFTGKQLGQSLFFNKVASLAQVPSCEFYEISTNNLFYRTPLVAASAYLQKIKFLDPE